MTAPSQAAAPAQYAADLLALTKPRIIALLLVTCGVAMWLAAGGLPAPDLLAATLAGTALAAGAANALNCYLDRDVDAMMSRTARRPLPAGRLAPEAALAFGLLLAGVAVAVLVWWVNLLSAGLALGAILFYVLVYTAWLKRTTPLNTVVGGVPGAAPPVIGWAAVTGSVDLAAVLLFAIVFLWQPPHFWALALSRVDEYRAAGLPMLPVVRGREATYRQMGVYVAALLVVSLLPYSLGLAGTTYLAAAVVLGGALAGLILWLIRSGRPRAARYVFGYSILYLTLLFAALVLDAGLAR